MKMGLDKFGLSSAKKAKICGSYNFDSIISNRIETQIQNIPLDKFVSVDLKNKINAIPGDIDNKFKTKEKSINETVRKKFADFDKDVSKTIQKNLKTRESKTIIDEIVSQKLVPYQQSVNGVLAELATTNFKSLNNFERFEKDIKSLVQSHSNLSESLKKSYKRDEAIALEQRVNGIEASIRTGDFKNYRNFANLSKAIDELKSKKEKPIDESKKETDEKIDKNKIKELLKNLDKETIQDIVKQLDIEKEVNSSLDNLSTKSIEKIGDQLNTDIYGKIDDVDDKYVALDKRVTEELLKKL